MRVVLVAILLALVGCRPSRAAMREPIGRTSIARMTATESPPGKVLFVSERTGDREIYAVRPDGSELERLTHDRADDYIGPIGPGGRLLGIQRYDTSERIKVPGGFEGPASRFMRHPSWLSHSHVVLESDLESFRDLYVLDVNEGALSRLTTCSSGCYEPAAALGGDTIAYASSDSGDAEIYRVQVSTREVTRLTWSRGSDSRPAFSPDAKSIAFTSGRGSGVPRIYLMGANGSRPRPLRSATEPDLLEEVDAAWSPDGSCIAFVARRTGRAGLRVVRVSDGAELASSDGPWLDQLPAWSPDGSFVALVSNRTGNDEVFIVRKDGETLAQLTDDPAPDWLPRWTH